MFESLKSNIYSSFFYNHLMGNSFEPLQIDHNIEEMYVSHNDKKGNKLVVFVKDEEIGKDIYPIIKHLKDSSKTISTKNIEFRIDKYFTDKENRVQIICASFKKMSESEAYEFNLGFGKRLLMERISFVNAMKENGYYLNESKFKNETCQYLSTFFSFFSFQNEDEEEENDEINQNHFDRCLIPYIHYVLSHGGNLEEFYKNIINNQIICKPSDFPYGLPVIKICYDFYNTGKVSENTNETLLEALSRETSKERIFSTFSRSDFRSNDTYSADMLIVYPENLEKNKIKQQCEDFTVYKNNRTGYGETIYLKIYNSISSDFAKFLNSNTLTLETNECNHYNVETFRRIIVNLEGDIIGYEYFCESYSNRRDFEECNILNIKFGSLYAIIDVLQQLYNKICELSDSLVFIYNENKDESDIEKCIRWYREEIIILSIQDLFNLVTDDRNCINKQIFEMFLKMVFKYIEENYGELSEEKQFLEITELRYLNPVITRTIIDFALSERDDSYYNQAIEEFVEVCKTFSDSLKNQCIHLDSSVPYYFNRPKFLYSQAEIPFIFDYEVNDTYGIVLKKGIRKILSDGRMLITFKKNCSVYKIARKKKFFSSLESLNQETNVCVNGISEIIYSKDINSDGMYKMVGYITTPMKGKKFTKLTGEVLLNLSNKAFLKVAGNLLITLKDTFISLDCVYMNEKFEFFINIFDDNFRMENPFKRRMSWLFGNNHAKDIELSNRKRLVLLQRVFEKTVNPNGISGIIFLQSVINFMLENGYNQYAFVGIDFSEISSKELIRLSNSYNAYCVEHNLYYKSCKKHTLCPVCEKTKYRIPEEFRFKNALFEDSYSKHYRLDDAYNLKVYKKTDIDLAKIDESITEFIIKEAHPELYNDTIASYRYYQDCFIPRKKAVNSNNQFIGYIYDAVDFKKTDEFSSRDLCIDIKNQDNFKNLHRIKSLIRLILQVQELLKRGMVFIYNPFTAVFLAKTRKKQVQISNIEFLRLNIGLDSTDDTIKWTCQYIYDVISSDNTIEIDSSITPDTSLENFLEKLQALSKNLTKYCPIHNLYYRKDKIFCPKCSDDERMLKSNSVVEISPDEITGNKYINQGGESFIYPYKEGTVAKVFKEEIDFRLKTAILSRVLAKKDILEKINHQNKKYKYIIPKVILVDKESKNIFAYVMDEVIDGLPLSTLSYKDEVKKLGFSRQDILEILITVGEGIEALHKKANIYIGDLNGRNILFDSEKNVYFLEFDGMGVEGIAPLFCTDYYIDPVSKKNQNITMKDDWYSFAIQSFYYLTYTHPFNGIYTENVNGKEVKLEIIDKMARRISLLGNHGIEPPTVTEPWDCWMEEELQKAFLNIFEGSDRSSIVSLLKQQYQKLYGNNDETELSNEITSISSLNPKFTAQKISLFSNQVVRVINDFAAVTCDENNNYTLTLLVNKENELPDFYNILIHSHNHENYENIKYVFVLENLQIVIVIYENAIEVYNLFGKLIVTDNQLVQCNLVTKLDGEEILFPVVNGNTLYFTKYSTDGKYAIHQIDFKEDGTVNEETINFLTNQQTKGFLAKSNSKFVIVKKSSDSSNDEVYCNSVKLCNIPYDVLDNDLDENRPSKYKVLYDKFTKLWLVINNQGYGGIINSSKGTFERINLIELSEKSDLTVVKKEDIENMQVENICFDKGIIYIPAQDSLCIINVKDQSTIKKMECYGIMTPNSRLYNINSKGFSVITDNQYYVVRKIDKK